MTTIGMLWYDNSKQPLEIKIKLAAAYYFGKYGKHIRSVCVNPADFAETAIDGIRVVASAYVQRNHLYVLENEETNE